MEVSLHEKMMMAKLRCVEWVMDHEQEEDDDVDDDDDDDDEITMDIVHYNLCTKRGDDVTVD